MNIEEIKNQILQIISSNMAQSDQINAIGSLLTSSGLPETAQSEILGLINQNLPAEILNNNLVEILNSYTDGNGLMETIGTATENIDFVGSIQDFFGGESNE